MLKGRISGGRLALGSVVFACSLAFASPIVVFFAYLVGGL